MTHNHSRWMTHSWTAIPPPQTTSSHSCCDRCCACWHLLILSGWETIWHPPHHHLQSLPWSQTSILCSQMPETAHQCAEDGCHRVVQMVWRHGGPDDACETGCLDVRFDAVDSK